MAQHRACKSLCALLLLLLLGASPSLAQDIPPPPYWHFAVVAADGNTVQIIFPKAIPSGETGFSTDSYIVQRSSSASFSSYDTLPSSFGEPNPLVYAALDSVSNWGGGRPYYRVAVVQGGQPIAISSPAAPVDQQGNIFVALGVPIIPGAPCGDLATFPCGDIKTALSVAPASGATVYVTPGIYNGPGNTNLDFGGKAITLQSTSGSQVTAINCTDPVTGLKTRAFSFQSGEGRDSVVSGFTITGGDSPTGGCVSIVGSAPTIQDCFFFMCNSTTGFSRGGAIYANANPSPGPLIQRSIFIYNQAQEGAGIYVESSEIEIRDTSFEWGICASATGRGGAVCAILSQVTATNVAMQKGIVGFGGGAMIIERSKARLDRVLAYNNTAGNFGGAFLLFGSELIVTNSNFTGNRGSIFAGALVITSSIYEATNTIHNDNWGRVGGGAVKVLGGSATLRGCQVNGNTAGYGAGFDIAEQGDLSTLPTNVLVEDTEVMNNVVTDKGAGFYLDSFDTVLFRRVRFGNNTATKGGAGWCNSATPAFFDSVTFEGNTAQMGGGIFADIPCRMSLNNAVFQKNIALEYGAGIALGDGTELNITNSFFVSNGVSTCAATKPPSGGGAIMVGVEQFKVEDQCGVGSLSTPSKVGVFNTSFVGNIALNKGGAMLVESGNVFLDTVQVQENFVIGDPNGQGEGLGGGLAVIERCEEDENGINPAACSVASAQIVNSAIANNVAKSAGGGIHFAGGSVAGRLVVSKSLIGGNRVSYSTTQDGVGGGLYIGRPNFQLTDINLPNNEGYYGGGMFIAADLSKNATIARIQANNNTAVLGSAAFWLRSASPITPLDASSMLIQPFQEISLATEVLSSSYTAPPPVVVQSSVEVDTFSVDMVDYYGNPGLAEQGGFCAVTADNSTNSDGTNALIRSLGSEAGVNKGSAVFSQVQVTGTIGDSYALEIQCTPQSLGRSRFLKLNGTALPELSMPVTISKCIAGSEPAVVSGGEICVQCPYNTFNVDGEGCIECPEGAQCPGGDVVNSQDDYWRSGIRSVDFYPCRTPDICNAGPVYGDEACVDGHQGPLCAVCKDDFFSFGGRCRACEDNGQAKAMLALTIILAVTMVVLIFAKSWEFGKPGTPGIMAKIKIFLAHLQVLAILREYDVVWPKATSNGLSWFEVINIGFGMLAPSCFIEDYSFWWVWVFQMVLPVIAVAGCVTLYYLAHFALLARDPDGSLVASGKATGLVAWLADLRIRCWKNAFWLITLLYPRSSVTALSLFSIKKLDTGTYLTSDFSIMVKPPGGDFTDIYIRYMIPGGIMLAIVAFGIPAFWFIVIWRNRHRLDDPVIAKKYGFLYGDYRREVACWETAEMLRKFLITFIPVFVPVQSKGSLQGTVGQILLLFYLVMTVWLRPFAIPEDNILQIASLVVLWLVLLAGYTAKWADLSPNAEKALAGVELLLSSAVGFICAAMVVLSLYGKYKAKRAAKRAELGEEPVQEKPKSASSKWGMLSINVRAGGRGSNQVYNASEPETPVEEQDGQDTPHLSRPFLKTNAFSKKARTGSDGSSGSGSFNGNANN